jgi:predicted nucleotidyltransferase
MSVKFKKRRKKSVDVKDKANLQKMIARCRPILLNYNVTKAGIFGSYARGEQTKESDIDIIIKPSAGMGLAFVGLALDIEKELGKKVDLVTYKSLHPLLKKSILEEEVRIL